MDLLLAYAHLFPDHRHSAGGQGRLAEDVFPRSIRQGPEKHHVSLSDIQHYRSGDRRFHFVAEGCLDGRVPFLHSGRTPGPVVPVRAVHRASGFLPADETDRPERRDRSLRDGGRDRHLTVCLSAKMDQYPQRHHASAVFDRQYRKPFPDRICLPDAGLRRRRVSAFHHAGPGARKSSAWPGC